MAINIGDSIPAIVLKDKNGEDFNLAQFVGEKALVVYFYPKNFTPGCTQQACDFRDKYEDFKDLGAEVIAISSDTGASHSRFAQKYELPFIFLSDEEKKARKAFGVKASLMGLVPGRETFLFDKKGNLCLRYNNMGATGHTSKALKQLKGLTP